MTREIDSNKISTFSSYLKECVAIGYNKNYFDYDLATYYIKSLYSDIGLSIPETLFYETFEDSIKNIDKWKKYTCNIMPIIWEYQLPLLLPYGSWQHIKNKEDLVDLSIRRTLDKYGCLDKRETIISVDGNLLSKNILIGIWKIIDELINITTADQYDDIIYTTLDTYEKESSELEKVMPKDCQAVLKESIFLGPLSWMIKEISMINFLIQEFGIRYYRPYVEYMNGIVKNAGIIIALKDICIICNK